MFIQGRGLFNVMSSHIKQMWSEGELMVCVAVGSCDHTVTVERGTLLSQHVLHMETIIKTSTCVTD